MGDQVTEHGEDCEHCKLQKKIDALEAQIAHMKEYGIEIVEGTAHQKIIDAQYVAEMQRNALVAIRERIVALKIGDDDEEAEEEELPREVSKLLTDIEGDCDEGLEEHDNHGLPITEVLRLQKVIVDQRKTIDELQREQYFKQASLYRQLEDYKNDIYRGCHSLAEARIKAERDSAYREGMREMALTLRTVLDELIYTNTGRHKKPTEKMLRTIMRKVKTITAPWAEL
jgi:hypothetical protein